MAHSQNGNALVCGLSTRKMLHALLDPELEHAGQLVPQLAPVRRFRSRTDRCPGTSSAGSRRTGSCRRRACGTTRGARARTGDRARTGTRCRARSRCRARAPQRPGAGSPPACRASREDRRVPALVGADRPRAADVVRRGVERVVLALALLHAPIGWIGGRYSTSKPIRATYGSRASTVGERAVPRRVVRRGARETTRTTLEKRARSRSTHDGKLVRCTWSRSAGRDTAPRAARASSSSPSAFSASALAAARPSRRRAARCAHARESLARRRPRARAAPRQRSTRRRRAPRCRRSSMSTRRSKSWRHDRNAIDPGAHGVAIAARRGDDERARASDRCRAAAIGRGCHSLVTVAAPQQRAGDDIVPVGEAVGLDDHRVADERLIAKRPPSTCGVTFSTTARTRPSATPVGSIAPARIPRAGTGRAGSAAVARSCTLVSSSTSMPSGGRRSVERLDSGRARRSARCRRRPGCRRRCRRRSRRRC